MVYNLRKKAIGEIPPLVPDQNAVGTIPPEPLFGVNQGIVDEYWAVYGNQFGTQADMVDGMGGIDAVVMKWNMEGSDPGAVEQVTNQQQRAIYNKTTSVKPFNLKTAQVPLVTTPSREPGDFQADQMGLQNEMGQESTMGDGPPWKDHAHFKAWLDNRASSRTIDEELRQLGLAEAKEAIEFYYSKKIKSDRGLDSPEDLLDYVNQIYNLIPDIPSLKVQGGEIMTKHKTLSEVEEKIKKIAKKYGIKKQVKSFNLKKTAQHKTMDNAIMWGPEQTRIDPFLHQPVSDWHIVERNKGFGLVVDDVWNIDYETIWRENIMDKYSRPYRDKEGNWVGGYIQKRFEVDKNIPGANNLQLKPGQIRRPILPEYGTTESRLQAARAAGDIEGAIDTSKPFNWKEASSKNNIQKESNILHSVCNNVTDKLSEEDIDYYIEGNNKHVLDIIASYNLDKHSKGIVTKHVDFLIRHDTPFLKASREATKKKR